MAYSNLLSQIRFSAYNDIFSFILTVISCIILGKLIAKLLLFFGVKSKLWAIVSIILIYITLFFTLIFINILFFNNLGFSIKFGGVGCMISAITSYKTIIKKFIKDGIIDEQKSDYNTIKEDTTNTNPLYNTKENLNSSEYKCPACNFPNSLDDDTCTDCGLRLK